MLNVSIVIWRHHLPLNPFGVGPKPCNTIIAVLELGMPESYIVEGQAFCSECDCHVGLHGAGGCMCMEHIGGVCECFNVFLEVEEDE